MDWLRWKTLRRSCGNTAWNFISWRCLIFNNWCTKYNLLPDSPENQGQVLTEYCKMKGLVSATQETYRWQFNCISANFYSFRVKKCKNDHLNKFILTTLYFVSAKMTDICRHF
jgi:hypothetical protein